MALLSTVVHCGAYSLLWCLHCTVVPTLHCGINLYIWGVIQSLSRPIHVIIPLELNTHRNRTIAGNYLHNNVFKVLREKEQEEQEEEEEKEKNRRIRERGRGRKRKSGFIDMQGR